MTRTRDWSVLHTFKSPSPRCRGRPSGDTAAHGGAPSGVNDFAVHPSIERCMLSVSKGERCMRLWNLVTGKKARALNFSREILTAAGEGRHSTGEARRIVWGSDAGEDEFAVGFDRDIVVFSMDCKPKCRLMKDVRTKLRISIHHGERGRGEDTAASFYGGWQDIVLLDEERGPSSDEEQEEGRRRRGRRGLAVGETGLPSWVARRLEYPARVEDFAVLPV